MKSTVENDGLFDIEEVEIAMVTWHVPALPTVPVLSNFHRIEAVWRERIPLDGKSQQGGSLTVYMPTSETLFGSIGLREVLPSDWYFERGNAMAHNPDSLEITREGAKEIVDSLARKMFERTAGELPGGCGPSSLRRPL